MLYENELYHHGVPGMKWGVRRYQNSDGSLTSVGRKRYSESSKTSTESRRSSDESTSKKSRINGKKVAIGVLATLTVATAATVYATNPNVRKAVNSTISKVGATSITAIKTGKQKTVNAGKAYAKEAVQGFKEGIKEGVHEAPKKAAKAIVVGATMNVAKRGLDASVGTAEASRIFKANNSKKIDSFWKVSPEDEDDDDDDRKRR